MTENSLLLMTPHIADLKRAFEGVVRFGKTKAMSAFFFESPFDRSNSCGAARSYNKASLIGLKIA